MKVAALRMAPPTMISIVAIVYIQGLYIGWEYFLVLQAFLQRDAARHDGCELNVVHSIGAGVASKVFFNDFLSNPANTSDKACDSCGVEDRFDELVVRHDVCGILRVLKLVGLVRYNVGNNLPRVIGEFYGQHIGSQKGFCGRDIGLPNSFKGRCIGLPQQIKRSCGYNTVSDSFCCTHHGGYI